VLIQRSPDPLAGLGGRAPRGREGGGEGKRREGKGGLTVVFGGLQLSSAGTARLVVRQF